MLYRKGSDILTSLHYLLYQVRLKKKNSSENEGLLKLGLSLSEEALLFRAAMTLNNILISKADASKKPLIDDDVDISKISLANLISDTDSKLWNFIYLLTRNKTLRQDIEKECGVDWSSHICHASESNTLKERTSKILMVISLCLFLCNDNTSLMQMMLSNITASFSGSSELNKIFNQLGITVSYESLHRYITKVVNLMNEDNMKMSFVPNDFVLTSIDNIDKGTPHASLYYLLAVISMGCMEHQYKPYNLNPIPLKTALMTM